MSGVMDAILDRVYARRRRYEHRVRALGPEELQILSESTPVLLGTCSFILLADRIRVLQPQYLIAVDSVEETATALARDYLHVKFQFGRGGDGKKVPLEIQNVPFPFTPYYTPGESAGLLAYVDLRAAYFTIVRRVGWRVAYRPGHYLGKEGSVADFPFPDHRLARNSLVTSAMPGMRRILKDRRLEEEATWNVLLNYPLLHVVSDVLHAVAWDLIERFEAVHVHTDGYILPWERADEAVRFLRDEWGLEARLRTAGAGVVKAPGAWVVGRERSLTFDVVRDPAPVNALREVPHRDWLRRRFRELKRYEEEV